jgi:hypothetical protein
VLANRLDRLVEQGILEKRPYQERPPRYEYFLTEKGIDLWPVVFALMKWGDRHVYPDGPPVVPVHRGCGGEVDAHRICKKCGCPLEARDVEARLGPGARPDAAERHPALR